MPTGDEVFGSVYEKGKVIFRQGDPGDTCYIIQSGAVEVSRYEGNSETVLALLEKGALFGEMALLDSSERSATVTAIRPTRLLPISKSSFLNRLHKDPDVTLNLIRILTQRIQNTNQLISRKVKRKEKLRAALGEGAIDECFVSPSILDNDAILEPDDALHDPVTADLLSDIWNTNQNFVWFEAGDCIFRKGDSGDVMFIIVKGTVEIRLGEDENSTVLACLGPGEFFGEMAIIEDSPRNASVFALERVRLMPIGGDNFLGRIKAYPSLSLYIIQTLVRRLREKQDALRNPTYYLDTVRQSLVPAFGKNKRVRISMISLSTCGGCQAIILEDKSTLMRLLESATFEYCPMLMDQEYIPEADVAIVDGTVRSKENEDKLEEVRAKSRILVTWGTCSAFGGIPAMGNRYELEELLEESYGKTHDSLSYYLSGKNGVNQTAYQETGLKLRRFAYKLNHFVRVDYCLPGCPPQQGALVQLINELTARKSINAPALVCGECKRKPAKNNLESLDIFSSPNANGRFCLTSQGKFCMGLVTKGGCGGVCPKKGLPCWGCRGPSKTTIRKMKEGYSFEEILIKKLTQRSHATDEKIKGTVRSLRKNRFGFFAFQEKIINDLSSVR